MRRTYTLRLVWATFAALVLASVAFALLRTL